MFDSEFSEQFIQGMSDRMAVSYIKYGAIRQAFPDKVNAIKSLELRLKQYKETGNTEFLMDVANYAMIEFMLPAHPNAIFKPTDSRESAGRIWYDKYHPTQQDNKGEK